MSAVLGTLGVVLLLVFGVVFGSAQLYAAFLGIEHHLAAIWALGAILSAFIFRFTLPITIGSFFGALNVWGWHWPAAFVFAAPGLLLMVPGVFPSMFSFFKRKCLE